jgi:hypothetical protein
MPNSSWQAAGLAMASTTAAARASPLLRDRACGARRGEGPAASGGCGHATCTLPTRRPRTHPGRTPPRQAVPGEAVRGPWQLACAAVATSAACAEGGPTATSGAALSPAASNASNASVTAALPASPATSTRRGGGRLLGSMPNGSTGSCTAVGAMGAGYRGAAYQGRGQGTGGGAPGQAASGGGRPGTWSGTVRVRHSAPGTAPPSCLVEAPHDRVRRAGRDARPQLDDAGARVALGQSTEVGGRQAQRAAQQALVDRVVCHQQRGAGARGKHSVPGQRGAVPQLPVECRSTRGEGCVRVCAGRPAQGARARGRHAAPCRGRRGSCALCRPRQTCARTALCRPCVALRPPPQRLLQARRTAGTLTLPLPLILP